MLAAKLLLVSIVSLGSQALPTNFFSNPYIVSSPFRSQASNPYIVSSPVRSQAYYVPRPQYLEDTPEVKAAKREFFGKFSQALNGLLYQLAPEPVVAQYLEDTAEVKAAKREFFRHFENAMNGLLGELGPQNEYLEDTPEVQEAKREFFEVFDQDLDVLLVTVEASYLEDTPEVKKAKEEFNLAFEDAKAGRIGHQYIAYTPEVKKAREEFLEYFDKVLDGFLETLVPAPVEPSYLPDTVEVKEAKKEFAVVFEAAARGDLAATYTLAALDAAINNNGGDIEAVAKEFVKNTDDIVEAIKAGEIPAHAEHLAPDLDTAEDEEGTEDVELIDVNENSIESEGEDEYADYGDDDLDKIDNVSDETVADDKLEDDENDVNDLEDFGEDLGAEDDYDDYSDDDYSEDVEFLKS